VLGLKAVDVEVTRSNADFIAVRVLCTRQSYKGAEIRNNGGHRSATGSVFIYVSKIYLRDLDPDGSRSFLY
jgi:hypothetical protein